MRRTTTAIALLIGCGGDSDSVERDAAVPDPFDAASPDAALDARSDPDAREAVEDAMSAHAQGTDASTADASRDASSVQVSWDGASWANVAWAPAMCELRSVPKGQLAALPAIAWEPCAGGLAGCTYLPKPDAPRRNARMMPGGLWLLQTTHEPQQTHALYDADLNLLFAARTKYGCALRPERSGTRTCMQVSHETGSAVVCGDLNAPSQTFAITGWATHFASSEVALANGLSDGSVLVIDTSSTEKRTTIGEPALGSLFDLTVSGARVLARYGIYDGVQYYHGKVYGWSAGTSWTKLLDPAGKEVLFLSGDGTHVMWSQAKLRAAGSGPYEELTYWSAPFSTTQLQGQQRAGLMYGGEDRLPIIRGAYAAQSAPDAVYLFELASGKRWKLPVPQGLTFWDWSVAMLSDQHVAFQAHTGDPNESKSIVRWAISEVVKRTPEQ